MDPDTYQMILDKLDELHDDLRLLSATVTAHISKDEQYYSEIYFIKRAVQVTWTLAVTLVGGWLAWVGLHQK